MTHLKSVISAIIGEAYFSKSTVRTVSIPQISGLVMSTTTTMAYEPAGGVPGHVLFRMYCVIPATRTIYCRSSALRCSQQGLVVVVSKSIATQ
jgi:hypothetical protein